MDSEMVEGVGDSMSPAASPSHIAQPGYISPSPLLPSGAVWDYDAPVQRTLTLFLAIVVGLLAGVSATAPPQRRPNIIYILADDLGYGELGSYGQTKIKTPHLDRMAAEGIRFTQHYSSSPVCAPARASFLTGLHTGHSPIRDNLEFGGYLDSEERGQMPLPKGTRTLPGVLKTAGYRTGIIGKWGLGGPGTEGQPTRHGFDYFLGYLDQKQAHNYYPTHLWRNEEWFPLRNPYFSPHQKHAGDPNDPASYEKYKGVDYSVDVMADDALRFIREGKDAPFFLYLPFTVPHLALQVPDDSLTQYDGMFDEKPYLGQNGYLPHPRPYSAYAGMISRMDGHIGRIFQLLKDLGLDEHTLVIFTSDNGTTYTGGADAAFFRSAGDLRGLKGSVYEGGIRVPFIARWPGKIAAGRVTDHLSAMWDMFPTFMDVAGLATPAGLDGISILPTLLGRSEQPVHSTMYWEYHGLWQGAQAVRLGNWKGVRLGGHTNADAPIELYDLSRDISEKTNVAAERPDLVARVKTVMDSRTESPVPQWNFRRHAAIERQDLAVAGVGSPFYRIPALTVTLKGTVLAAFDARPTLADLPGSIAIVLRRSTDGGRTWRPQTVVRSGQPPEGFGDPSLLVDRVTGRIFLFHAASQRQGYFGSAAGNRHDDPEVLQADYSYSDDDGVTWQHRRITHGIKDPTWGGIFAASGQGIQLRYGPHAGRLVQQYVVRLGGKNWAASAYSDDHGDTWRMGQLIGPDADENKSVELSDGRLMLTIRARPVRKVAWSSDGGATWSGLRDEPALVDPANNGSVVRVHPDAPAGTAEARQLLFSNTETRDRRENLVVKLSCDDGATWPVRRVVEAGPAAYSTLTRLADGRFGLLYERGNVDGIVYATFDLAWVGSGCPAGGGGM